MKIKSFVSAIVCLFFGCLVSIVCFQLIDQIVVSDGIEKISLVVFIPVGIILLFLSLSLNISSFISSFSCFWSENNIIKIISILLLLLSLAVLGLTIFNIIRFIQIF